MRIGTVCYATHQGLGYLAKSFYDAGVITEVVVWRHPHGDRPSHMEWYPQGTVELTKRPFSGLAIEDFLAKVDVCLFFETPFCWDFVKRCYKRKVKTAIIPMYEWFLQNPPCVFDKFINPSLLDQDYFPHGEFIPIPVDSSTWSLRTTANRFLHNGGNLGCRGHKGTLELMQAMKHVKSNLHLTIRSQDSAGLRRLISQVPEIATDRRVKFEFGNIPYENLFDGYDVLVAPEKFNGLSLPLQEAHAAGLGVITTDRYPTNTWLPKEMLIPCNEYRKAQTMRGHLEFDEAVVDPVDIAQTLDNWYGKHIEQFSLVGLAYAQANSWGVLKRRYLSALESCL